ncbi:MAG: hypothetical protein KJO65_10305, partial [Gemmatimonadetes bacterium]|nr:hypothetical protein [Gemmatimonadota bacterium]
MPHRHSTSSSRPTSSWWGRVRTVGNLLTARVIPACIGLATLIPADAVAQEPRVLPELEGGPVWQSSNNVEVPNDGTATRFSLTDLAGTGPTWAGRAYLSWRITERSSIRLLFAPLTFTETGTPSSPLRFEGEDFVAGTPLDAMYTFNSYRLSYRWRAKSTEGAD